MNEGRCITVRVSVVGQVGLWTLAVILMTVGTVSGAPAVRAWALLVSAGSASWTIIYALARQHHLMVEAFELGRSLHERSSMRPVP